MTSNIFVKTMMEGILYSAQFYFIYVYNNIISDNSCTHYMIAISAFVLKQRSVSLEFYVRVWWV